MYYKDHIQPDPEKYSKSTLQHSDNILLGLNCLTSGQEQSIHAHQGQDKFYYVIEGQGEFTLGEEQGTYGPGHVVWAPAGLPHGVRNTGDQDLILLVGITPSP
jgi:quercetin dioxygenase-like cupin family protein